MNHPKIAKPDHPILDVLSRRWSPYAFADRAVSEDDLRALFEAARWAASSYNEQPWRYLVATKSDSGEFSQLLSCLAELNQAWANAAPVLAIGCTVLDFAFNGKANGMAVHDLGLASGNLSAEATARGLVVHQMAGILPDRVKELYGLPDGTQAITGLAIGYAADAETLSKEMRERDLTPRTRRPLGEFVFGGSWATPSRIVTK